MLTKTDADRAEALWQDAKRDSHRSTFGRALLATGVIAVLAGAAWLALSVARWAWTHPLFG